MQRKSYAMSLQDTESIWKFWGQLRKSFIVIQISESCESAVLILGNLLAEDNLVTILVSGKYNIVSY
jgi:hypothetical protein